MPDLDDYHAFKNTSGNHSGGSSNGGCLNTFVWFFVLLSLVMVAGKFCG